MSNGKLYVDSDKLYAYGNTLNDKATEFSNIKKEMKTIVENLRTSWSGTDAKMFISNATEYLDNLDEIETILNNYGGRVKAKSSNYSQRCADFYSRLMG